MVSGSPLALLGCLSARAAAHLMPTPHAAFALSAVVGSSSSSSSEADGGSLFAR